MGNSDKKLIRKKNQIIPDNTFMEFLLYITPNGKVRMEIFLKDETIGLTQDRIAEFFGVQRQAVTTPHGAIEGMTQTRPVKLYNLDPITSVGYRGGSRQATLLGSRAA